MWVKFWFFLVSRNNERLSLKVSKLTCQKKMAVGMALVTGYLIPLPRSISGGKWISFFIFSLSRRRHRSRRWVIALRPPMGIRGKLTNSNAHYLTFPGYFWLNTLNACYPCLREKWYFKIEFTGQKVTNNCVIWDTYCVQWISPRNKMANLLYLRITQTVS